MTTNVNTAEGGGPPSSAAGVAGPLDVAGVVSEYLPAARLKQALPDGPARLPLQQGIGGHSLEVYGDWSSDPSKLVTTIQYLLR
jgi:hypothetical protein